MSDAAYDLVIIGSGVGGMTAAIAAKLEGLNPLLVEKTPLVGGSSALSGGILWLPNNPVMQRDGIADSRQAALAYLANFVQGEPAWSTSARREAFVDAIAPMIAMLEGQGMTYRRCNGYADYYDTLPGGNAAGRALEVPVFNANRLGAWKARLRPPPVPMPIHTSEGASMMRLGITTEGKKTAAKVAGRFIGSKLTGRTVYGMGAALQGRMLEIVLRLGIDIWTEAAFVGFELAGDRVTGARVQRQGRTQSVPGRLGVLVTAGGFSHNTQMRQTHQRAPITADWTYASPGDTGEAISAMMALGADTALMHEAWWNMTFMVPGKPPGQDKMAIVADLQRPHSILVDAAGQRFVNEANSYMEVGSTSYDHGAVPAWFIADASFRKRYFFGLMPPGAMPKKLVASGAVKQADTLGELARQCAIDASGLEATVKRFNGFAAAGKDDDFQRGDSAYNRYYADPTNTPNPSLGPIDKPPYWAVPLYPGDVGTCGGVVTNAQAQVLRKDASPIPGLYAAGNCSAPLASDHYIGAGQSLATSSIFAYLAVKDMTA